MVFVLNSLSDKLILTNKAVKVNELSGFEMSCLNNFESS